MDVFVKASVTPFQIDGFKKGVERSAKGALYFRPSTLKTITFDEWKKIVELKIENRFVVSSIEMLKFKQFNSPKKPTKREEKKTTTEEPRKVKKSKKKLKD